MNDRYASLKTETHDSIINASPVLDPKRYPPVRIMQSNVSKLECDVCNIQQGGDEQVLFVIQ